jgi:DNA primase
MRISQRSIEEVRERADIVEVASEFTALRRQGARFTGLCPYPDHNEKSPSFSVTPERGFYHCFGCQRGGDAIKLVMDLRSLPFTEAISYLADRSNIELQFEGSSPAESLAAEERTHRRRAIHKALAAAAVYYHKYLIGSSTAQARRAREYLESRGFDDSTIVEFRIGFAPPRGAAGFIGVARGLGLDGKTLEAAGLLNSRGGERFAGRVTFPISERRGRIVGFGARAMGDTQPKYLNSPETEVFNKRELLYGVPQVLDAVRREKAVLVVEGYTDVLMLYQKGIGNAVATLGTATTPGHLRALSRYADRILLLFDPDAAGEKAIERAAATAAELKLDLRVLRLSEDPADWLLSHSPEEFRALLEGSVPVLEYGVRRIVDRNRGAGATERSRAVPELRALIREIQDPVLRREALRLATEALGVGPEVFREERDPAPPGSRESPPPSPPHVATTATSDPHRQAGRDVLALALTRPDLTVTPLRDGVSAVEGAERVRLRREDFADSRDAGIFGVLAERAGEGRDRALMDERLRPHMDYIAALASAGERLFPTEASVREAWLRLAILSRQRAKRKTADFDVKERLRQEILDLTSALRASSVP